VRLDLAESALAAPAAGFGGVGFLGAVEFSERNGYRWTPPLEDEPDGD